MKDVSETTRQSTTHRPVTPSHCQPSKTRSEDADRFQLSSNNLPLLNNPALAQTAANVAAFALLREDVPEPERLVTGASDDRAAVGAHAEIQHTVSVSCERDDLRHARVFPDVDGMLGVTVSAHKFRSGGAEEKVADLAAGIVGAEEVWIQRRGEVGWRGSVGSEEIWCGGEVEIVI